MIARVNIILAAVLIAQLGFIGIRTQWTPANGAAASRGLLLDGIDTDALVELRIEAADEAVNVERDTPGDRWRVAELFGYSDPAKVTKTLRELAALEIAEVVSTSGEHHQDLKVSDDNFDRRVTLTGTAGTVEILFGSSGRANSAHVRKAGDPTVYSVRDFSSWKLSAQADSWIDRTYFAANRQQVTRLAIENAHGALRVERDGPKNWTLITADNQRLPADGDAVDTLLGKATAVTMMEVAGKLADHPLAPPVIEIVLGLREPDAGATATGTEGAAASRILRIAKKPGAEERYWLHAADAELVGEASKWSVQALVDAKAADLLPTEPAAPTEPASPASPASAAQAAPASP